MACYYKHLIICVALSHPMQYGQTALHKACYGGHMEIVKMLIQAGASIDEKDIVRLLSVHDQCCVGLK